MHLIQFKEWTCRIEFHTYANNRRTALQFVEMGSNDVVATVTVNMEKEEIEEGDVFIKSYSENEGVYELLVEFGYVEKYHRIVKSGFSDIYVCKLLIKE